MDKSVYGMCIDCEQNVDNYEGKKLSTKMWGIKKWIYSHSASLNLSGKKEMDVNKKIVVKIISIELSTSYPQNVDNFM